MSLASGDPRPRLLDLFCGAGGCTAGYQRAGFDVIGVDIRPQPRYCGDGFFEGNALAVLRALIAGGTLYGIGLALDHFDAIHASPPCQHYANVTQWRGDQDDHPDLVGPTRELLKQTGLPWVLENVREADVRADFHLCGTALNLRVRRHRHFETNWSGLVMSYGCQHAPTDYAFDHGAKQPESVYRDAMGCDWMTVDESREAIPPAYCEFIGAQLLDHLRVRSAA